MRIERSIIRISSGVGIWSVVAGAILAAGACKDGGISGPSGPRIGSVAIAPDTATLTIDKTIQLSVAVRDTAGQPLSGIRISWASSDAGIVAVNGDGLARAKSPGSARITATANGVSGNALFLVVRPRVDSTTATTPDSTTVTVNEGTSITFSPGALPPGTRVKLEELNDVIPIPDASLVGRPVRVTFTVPQTSSAREPALQAQASLAGPLTITLNFRTRVTSTLDNLQNRVYVAFREAQSATTRAVVKADNAIEKAGQYGERFIETRIVIPATTLVSGTYDFVAYVNALGQQTCDESAWSLKKIPLTSIESPSVTSPDRIPLILVHGFQYDKLSCAQVQAAAPEVEVWSQFISALKSDASLRDRYEVWVYRYPTQYPFAESARRLTSRISDKALASRDIVVVGHSMGGLVSAQYVAESGQRTRALVTLGTPFGGTPLARMDYRLLGSLASYTTCVVVQPVEQFLALVLLTKGHASQLSPQSPALSALAANSGVFAPRLWSFSGTYNFLTLAGNLDIVYRIGGCMMSLGGYPANDGLVPLAATYSGPDERLLGAAQKTTLDGIHHGALIDAASPLSAVKVRLGILGQDINTAAKALQNAGGDRQAGAPGATLPQPLSVRAVDAAGVPVAGVQVSFEITAGGGAINPAAATTDVNGFARTTWTLGSLIGTQRVSATSSGIPTARIDFDAMAGPVAPNACPTQSYTIGTTIQGTLDTGDCRFSMPPYGNDAYFESFETVFAAPQAVRLSMTATFRPRIGARGPYDRAFNYTHAIDAQSGASSVSTKLLAPAGTITLRPASSAAQTTGTYSFSSTTASSDVDQCETVLILPGVDTQQQLRSTDCQYGSRYSDQYRLGLPVGATLIVEQLSRDFDAFLSLSRGGSVVAQDDDGAGGTDALLRYTSSQNMEYVISATSFDDRSTGAYRLRVTIVYPASTRLLTGDNKDESATNEPSTKVTEVPIPPRPAPKITR